jgi:hypothetical protein
MNKSLLVAVLSVAMVSPAVSAPRGARITVVDQPISAWALVRGDQVLLPLRETFAALNSQVAYDPDRGTIEARNILHVLRVDLRTGSATLDGRHLSSKAIVVDGAAYFPLSPAAEAMGAIVRYDPRTNTVAVNESYRGKERYDPAHPPRELNPPPDSSVQTGYPVISASLGEAYAASNAVRLSVDGNDVTPQTHFDGRTITYVPSSSLDPGRHTIAFDGNVSTGQSFYTHWSFTSSAPAANWYAGYGYAGNGYGYHFYADQFQPFAGGSLFNLTMVGPPAGSGFVQICNPNFMYPLWNGGSRWYRARIALPSAFFSGCGISATFIGPDGRRILVPMSNTSNGLYLTGNPISPLGSYLSAPLFVPVLTARPVRWPQ